jgi:hypothetical protein
MVEIEKEFKEKGKEAENKFKEWLDKHNITYLYISQNQENYSQAFRKTFSGKRPDFIVLIPNFGCIFVDVKSRKLSSEFKTFPIDIDDVEKYSSVHSIFNLPIWFVISNEECGYMTWYWLSIAKILSKNISQKISSKSKEGFFPIPIKYFKQIADNESINKLFSAKF